MTFDEYFPVPDDDLPTPQDDQPEAPAGDLDAERPIDAAGEPEAAAPETPLIPAEDEHGAIEPAAPPLPGPPRIVAEEPVGEKRPAAPGLRHPPAPPLDQPLSAPGADEPAPPAEAGSEIAEAFPAEPELTAAEEIAEVFAAGVEEAGEALLTELEPAAADESFETAIVAEAEEAGEALLTELEAAADESAEAQPAEPGPIRSRSTLAAPEAPPAEKARAEEWGEDLSPELAAILFAGAAATAEAPAREEAVPAAEGEIPALEKAAPVPRRAGPVTLLETSDARRLPIAAQGIASPAPDEMPGGKARYVRVEEPLGKDDGQRISETWSYFKPDYPALEGRLVRSVHIEEYRYADGSWKWTFERQYTDRGRDTREVRASRDQTYIERHDRIARKDPSTNRRVRVHERAQMILMGPEHEEKRGLLRRLFRRGEPERANGPAEWRPATPAEARSARGAGGQAFGGKLFGLF